ncbi:facilitated trehalose transporter Tret1-like [Zeugodacus cucurbitae]|uniref:facilitated trehalose transporter Tret1-like n=1 Tax=Zeugodacus cucurbitae TaxID=28588 RepID=UPI0023D951B9|nr:facilitated trehalose transporter Tret1-like [Zeugodacus cucurbitae]
MLFNFCNNSEGVFNSAYRMQLLAAASVTIITFCNGIGIGWCAPMLAKLQSPIDSPLDFTATVQQTSWIGSLVCVGGITGNVLFGVLLDRIGRKACIYLLAIPHMCFWILVYFAPSIEYLYAARFASGITGGGTWVVIPIFISEIADPTIRGRLTSLFTLFLNGGMLTGYTLSSYVPYHIIPMAVILLPLLYLIIETYFPETPSYLLHCGKEEEAEKSLKFYLNYRDPNKLEVEQFNIKYAELKSAVKQQKSQSDAVTLRDFFTKRALRALTIANTVILINIVTGSFTLLSYMSTIFVAVKTDIHPDTNTVIIGVVQILGAYIAIILVDRFGRKVLLMISTASTGICLAAFGTYAFFVEETSVDLTPYRSWLPLVLMALIILTANVGIIPVPAVVIVEILPPKIRAKGVSFCVTLLSFFAFVMLKVFPPCMEAFGLATTVWGFAVFSALGLLYIAIFVPETKGRSMNVDED